MIRSKRIGNNIYPDFDRVELDLIKRVLEEYDITLEFLFEDGVEFFWDDTKLQVKNSPGDISFWKVEAGKPRLILLYLETWENLRFYEYKGEEETEILRIPIYEQKIDF